MDFNLKKYIEDFKEKSEFRRDEGLLEEIVEGVTGIPCRGGIALRGGKVSFPTLPTMLVVRIKMSKREIISKAREKGFFIHDII